MEQADLTPRDLVPFIGSIQTEKALVAVDAEGAIFVTGYRNQTSATLLK